MLDGRVLEASQVEYKPFGKPPLQRETEEEDTAASALLLKHEFLDGGADDVTLATLGEVLLEPTLATLGNFLVRSNSQSSVASARWEASSWRATP